jgi:flagellar motor switch protein FliG
MNMVDGAGLDLTKLNGPQKAAAFMLAIGEEYGRNIW